MAISLFIFSFSFSVKFTPTRVSDASPLIGSFSARPTSRARTFDFFERSSVWDAAPERFRLHAVAVQRAADRLDLPASDARRVDDDAGYPLPRRRCRRVPAATPDAGADRGE